MATIQALPHDHWRVHVFLERVDGRSKTKAVTVCPRACVEVRHRQNLRHDGSKRGRARLFESIEEDVLAEYRSTTGGVPITMAEVFGRWVEHGETSGELRDTTRRNYRSVWKARLADEFGALRPWNVTTQALSTYRDRIAKVLAPSTVNQDLAIVRGALRYALEQGWIDDAPKVRRARMGASATQAPDEDDVAAVMRHLIGEDPALAMLVSLATTIGARRGELLALTWADIRTDRHGRPVVSITKSLGLRRKVGDTKTHQGREVPIAAGTLDLLGAWRANLEARYGLPMRATWPVFPSREDLSMPPHPDNVTHAIAAIVDSHKGRTTPCSVCGRCEIGRVWLHGLRHLSASSLLAAGVELAEVAERLGHASMATTAGVYAHALPEKASAAAEIAAARTAELFGG